MADKDIEFVDGLIVKPPRANAPGFVKASISIKVEDLGKWLRGKYKAGDEWVNVDVKEAKSGKWYCSVSTFKPKEKKEEPKAGGGGNRFSDMADDIPFAPLRKLESSLL
jgi:hypothetical protein